MTIKIPLSFSLLALMLSGALCQKTGEKAKQYFPFHADQQRMMSDLKEIASRPHPFGSSNQRKVAQFIKKRLEEQDSGIVVKAQPFVYEVPNPDYYGPANLPTSPRIEKFGENIFATLSAFDNRTCIFLIGSHYDSKDLFDLPSYGANDSGSTSSILIELLRVLASLPNDQKEMISCQPIAVWFDGEESVLPNWNDWQKIKDAKKDNTYGSRYAVSQLATCISNGKKHCLSIGFSKEDSKSISSLTLLDMLGSKNFIFSRDSNSDSQLSKTLDDVLKQGGLENKRSKQVMAIDDDHLPFLEAGIPSLDIIDFHNTMLWHEPADVWTEVSPETLSQVLEIVLNYLINIGK